MFIGNEFYKKPYKHIYAYTKCKKCRKLFHVYLTNRTQQYCSKKCWYAYLVANKKVIIKSGNIARRIFQNKCKICGERRDYKTAHLGAGAMCKHCFNSLLRIKRIINKPLSDWKMEKECFKEIILTNRIIKEKEGELKWTYQSSKKKLNLPHLMKLLKV